MKECVGHAPRLQRLPFCLQDRDTTDFCPPCAAPGDQLVGVQDNNKNMPIANPGALVRVTTDNYHEALDLVRSIDFCKLFFSTPGAGVFR